MTRSRPVTVGVIDFERRMSIVVSAMGWVGPGNSAQALAGSVAGPPLQKR
jgi:hypothetical protein